MTPNDLESFLGSVALCIGIVAELVTVGAFLGAAREAEQARQYALDAADVASRL